MGIAEDVLGAIDAQLESAQEDGMREHLGASLIGRVCERELFYSFRWALPTTFEGRMLRLFERGHLEEFRFEKWIEEISEQFWAIDPRTNSQIRVSDLYGYFGGSLDGVVRSPAGYEGDFLTEFKTHSLKSFEKLKMNGVKDSKPEHYVQMQIYLHYKPQLKGALYFAICKNDDQLYIEYVERDEQCALDNIDKAKRIIVAKEPPAPHDKASEYNFYCKHFCDFTTICEFGGGRKDPHKTCRSCAFIKLTEEGWMCSNDDVDRKIMTGEEQKQPCEKYERGF